MIDAPCSPDGDVIRACFHSHAVCVNIWELCKPNLSVMFGACLLFLFCGVNRLHTRCKLLWTPVDLMHGCHYRYTQFHTVQLGCTLFFLPRRKSELSLFRLHWRYIKVIMFARMHICATPIPNSSKQWTFSVFVFFRLLSTMLLKGVKALCVCACVCAYSLMAFAKIGGSQAHVTNGWWWCCGGPRLFVVI